MSKLSFLFSVVTHCVEIATQPNFQMGTKLPNGNKILRTEGNLRHESIPNLRTEGNLRHESIPVKSLSFKFIPSYMLLRR